MLGELQARWKLVVVPTVVCAVAAGALATGHILTKNAIVRQRRLFKLTSVRKVLPACDNDPGADTDLVPTPDGGKVRVYRCKKAGKVIAVAFSVDSAKNKHHPYSGTIEVLVGLTADGRIVARSGKPGLVVLRHSETPGLGARIETAEFQSNFLDASGLGRNLTDAGMSCGRGGKCFRWAVKKDDVRGFVDAISGATISSRAFTEIVHRALTWFSDAGFRAMALTGRKAGGAGGVKAPGSTTRKSVGPAASRSGKVRP